VWLGASLLIPYFVLTIPQIHRLGINTEEAFVATAATSGYRFVGWDSAHFSPQLAEYHGSLESILGLPFFLLFGYTSAVLRLTMIFWGAATLVAFFFLARELFRDSASAWCAAWMLATLPAFVSGTYFGFYHGSLMLFFQAGGSASLMRWARKGRDRYLYSGLFLLGCGVACRLWFAAVLAATAAASLLLLIAGDFPPQAARGAGSNRRRALLSALSFFLGALPVILVVWNNGAFPYWAILREILVVSPHKFAAGPSYAQSLSQRFEAVRMLLIGDAFLQEAFPALGYAAPMIFKAVVCASVWLPLSCLLKGGRISRARRLLLPVYIAACFAVLSTSGHFAPNHQLVLLPPLILMIVAAAADAFGRIADGRRYAALLALLAVAWPAITRPWQLQRQLREATGTPPEYADVLPAVARWLDANPLPEPLLVDEGAGNQLQFYLTRRYAQVGLPDLEHSLPEEAREATYYIAFHPDQIPKLDPHYRRLAIERLGAQARVVHRFNDRGGNPIILVYRLPRPRRDLNLILVSR
jgi:4-amino-4-deoxy-L-arabinose transferase-like glycosyltransferase